MRLQQLIYFEKIIEKGSINEAAKALYLTQPSLSNALKELENEMKVQLLVRNKQGIIPTAEGREFLIYVRQILDQVNLLEEKFKNEPLRRQNFSVSAQHYAFVVHAFVELLRTVNAKPHVFVSRTNPLVAKKSLKLADLEDYPYLSYEQGENNSFYFSEEILSTWDRRKNIKVSDRATIFNLMVGLNGYTISSGIISSELNDDKIVAIPLEYQDVITLGWIKQQQLELSPLAQSYLELLKEHIRGYGFDIIE